MNNTKTKLTAGVSILLSVVTLFSLFAFATPASALTCNSATLTGTVETNMPPTQAWFEWGKNYNTVASGGGNRTQTQTFNSAGTFPIEQFISGLNENESYHYRLVAMDGFGTEYGAIRDFTTPACAQANPPTVAIYANPTSVPFNGTSTVTWNSANATSCSSSNGANGWATNSRGLSGSFFTGNLTNTTTFNITCTNNTSSASASTTVFVSNQPPQTCQDPSATNYLGALPCQYAPQTCQDPSAINYHGTLPCQYYQPPTTCQDPSATNYHVSFPCQYPVQTCQDPAATNYHVSFPCQYQQPVNPTVTLTANPTSITTGQNSTLTWSSQNATSCSAYWTGSTATSGSGLVVPGVTTTYTITCYGTGGRQATAQATVVVNQAQAPTVTLTANPTSITTGQNSTLTWSSQNATSCSAYWTGSTATSGSGVVVPGVTTTYAITCYGVNGQQASASATVYVNQVQNQTCQDSSANNYGGYLPCTYNTQICQDSSAINYRGTLPCRYPQPHVCQDPSAINYRGYLPCTYPQLQVCQDPSAINYRGVLPCVYNNIVNNRPTVVLTADQTSLPFNGATTVRWSTTSATSCFASDGSVGWAGTKNIGPGAFFTGSLTGTRTYTMTCSNNAGSSTDSVTVSVRGQVLGTSTTYTPPPSSLVLISSSVDRNQPIVPTLDNTNPCPGDEINYAVTYQNVGTASVTNLNLQINLPQEVDYMFSNPSNPMVSGNSLMFNLGTLRANGQGTVTIRVRVRNNVPAGTSLNFPATLSYVTGGFPQSVSANVSANVCGVKSGVALGANVFGAGFLPDSIFGWLLLLILILILILLAKYLFDQPFRRKTVTTVNDPNNPLGQQTTTTTIHQ